MVRFVTKLLPLCILAMATSAQAQIRQSPNPDDASAPVLARDVPTDMDDRTITNHCVEGRRDKSDCLCATKILKYELPVRDYRTIATRVTPAENTIPPLAIERYRADMDRPAKPVDPVIRTILDDPLILERCRIADRYFETG